LAIAAVALIIAPEGVLAQSGGKQVSSAELSTVSATINGKERVIFCHNGKAGKVKLVDFLVYFFGYRKKSRQLKQRGRARRAARFAQLAKEGKQACLNSGPQTYFLPDGNVNDLGRAVLKIPKEFDANIFEGQLVYNDNCIGCHAERPRSFNDLRTSISPAPMYYKPDRLSDALLAHLVAYLSRNRRP